MAKAVPFPKLDDVVDTDFFFRGRLLSVRRTNDPNTLLLDVHRITPPSWICQYAWKVTESSLLPRTEQCNENQRLLLETEIRRTNGWQPLTPSYLIQVPRRH